nr:MAG TPA: hypothetical protein [Caudoviricetes sp.]
MSVLYVVQLYCRLIRPMNVFDNYINDIAEIQFTFTFFQNKTPDFQNKTPKLI